MIDTSPPTYLTLNEKLNKRFNIFLKIKKKKKLRNIKKYSTYWLYAESKNL